MSYDWDATGLPAPTNNFGARTESQTIRTQMDNGRFRQRNRFTAALTTLNVRWELTDLEYKAFRAIHLFKLHGGADWFTISLPMGNGLTVQTARFVGNYAADYKDVLVWNVTATLEIEAGSEITESELNAILPL